MDEDISRQTAVLRKQFISTSEQPTLCSVRITDKKTAVRILGSCNTEEYLYCNKKLKAIMEAPSAPNVSELKLFL